MKAHETIVRMLEAEDVQTIFTLMSEDIMELLAVLEGEWADDIRVVEARHEQGAMAMADGYARATGEIAVCIAGRGPGIAQTGTSLVTASKKGSKVLVLAPETPTTLDYDMKEFHQEMYLRSTVGDVVSIRSHDTLISKLEQAFRELKTGGGPLAVQVPWDLLDGEMDDVDESFPGGAVPVADTARSYVEPDRDTIEAAVDLYLDSDATKPPIILAGEGAVRSGGKEAIERLAERMNAYLTTTLQARGYFHDHPYGLGFVGGAGDDVANEFFIESDFVLALGCSLNDHTTDSGYLVDDGKKVVQVDTDPASIERFTPVDLGIVGDVRASVEAFEGELDEIGIDRADEFWSETVRERAREPPWDDDDFLMASDRVDPRELVLSLNDVLPQDRYVTVDGGHFVAWILNGLDVTDPGDFLFSLDFVALGQGLPMGLGAAFAADEGDRTSVAFCGDAGFMMALQELDTAVREQVPIVIFVLNDDAYGAEYHMLSSAGKYADAAHIDAPDLADVAASLGAKGHTVRGVEDLETVRDSIGTRPDGPVVVDCKINRDVKDMWWE